MGLETEKADVQLFMDEDAYSHHSGLDYAHPAKCADSDPDRDPNQLNEHLKDYNAFCKDLPNGPAFSADNMEERDRRRHCPVVCERRAHPLFCQRAAEPRLNTWSQVCRFGYCPTSLLLQHKATTVLFIPQLCSLRRTATFRNVSWQIFFK
ncbi:caveolin-2 isoform X3 [Myotis yumanensis]|uniref:caveolin-2 isoform X3 n=1 Tax=Myotis yumanensis TaxID=159337 RepID=UPI0038CF95BE